MSRLDLLRRLGYYSRSEIPEFILNPLINIKGNSMARQFISFITLFLLFSGNVNAQDAVLGNELESLIATVEEQVIEWRRDIHEHPELGNREFRTAALVADHLRSLGIEVETEVAHTGVVGLLKGGKPGPVVLLRADMDGLPVTERVDIPFASKVTTVFNGQETGVMHACGHDTHVAILMGVASVLAAVRDKIPGTIKFVFQPAEEGPPEGEDGGAELMVREGVLSNPEVDVAFALHISSKLEVNTISYTPGGTYASADDFRIRVRGQQTHGAYPWNGVDPIVTSAHIITALQSIVSREMMLTENAAIVTVGMIRGGLRSNIIPEEVEMLGTIRALDPADRLKLHASVRRIAENTARSFGAAAEVTIPVTTAYPVTYNDPELTAFMVPVLQDVAGAENVQQVKAEMGAEDFSFFAEIVPGFYITLGGRPADVAEEDAADHHTPDFYIDDSGLVLGVRAMTAMALHYMKTNQ
jgi:amidohydrolase